MAWDDKRHTANVAIATSLVISVAAVLFVAAHSNRVLHIEVCSCPAGTLLAAAVGRESAMSGNAAAGLAPPAPFGQIKFNGGSAGNALWEYFQLHQEGPLLHKWLNYFEPYHRHFSRFRGRKINFLEIGVQSGGAIGMWQSYFGKDLISYYGVDINFMCKEIFGNLPGVNIATGDQANLTFWEEYLKTAPVFDIILDDGGHWPEMQIVTFESMYPRMAPDGVYMVEDTLTSYQSIYHAGYRQPGTFMEYSKAMIDHLHGNHITDQGDEYPSSITRSTVGFHVYDNMVVWERGTHPPSANEQHGTVSLPYWPVEDAQNETYIRQKRAEYAPWLGADGKGLKR